MAAFMARRHRGHVCYLVTRIHCPSAEIHILEPDRIKLLVEAAQLFPNVPPHHEESAGWLFHHCRLIVIAIQATVAAVYRIRRPQPVYPEQLADQRRGSREAAQRK